MKVHLYGNTLNNAYNLCIFLRRKGIQAEMFLDNSSTFQQDFPWWEDKELSGSNLPDWIHYYKVKPNFLFPQSELKRLISDFSNCDVALVGGWGPIIAKWANVPYLFHSHGGDLNITSYSENLIGFARNILRLKKPQGLKSFLLHAYLQKAAILNADRLGIYMGYQVNPYVKKLGLLHKMTKLRLAWDVEKYNIPEDKTLSEKYKKYEIVYFMFSRHSWKSVWNDLKGNDKFIRAFGRFIRERTPNVLLVMIEKGNDIEESKKLIADLNLESKVEWVKEMDKDGIRAFNSLQNVIVVDQFWHDKWYIRYPSDKVKPRIAFGSGSIEALSAARPLITVFFDEDFYDGNHPPILSAFTEDQIYNRLLESYDMGAAGRKKMGIEGYEFVKKYHGWQNAIELHIGVLREILQARKQGDA
jgi:hypothetical protein